MKSKINIITLLIFTVILSSCGSLSVTQMRYTRGLNINLSTREKVQEEHKAKVAEKNNSTAKRSMSKEIESDEILVVQTSVDETKDEIQSYSSSNIRSGSSSSSSSDFKGLKNSIKKNIAPGYKAAKQINLNKTNFRSSGKQETNDESGVALLLLVIIALFVPPLAVLLYYGEINGQFWISLLLTLLALGAFGLGFIFGWGVPVIHALLVIFGIFD